MKIKITGKELMITDAINDYVEKKLDRIDKYFEEAEAEVTLKTEKNEQIAEIYKTTLGLASRKGIYFDFCSSPMLFREECKG